MVSKKILVHLFLFCVLVIACVILFFYFQTNKVIAPSANTLVEQEQGEVKLLFVGDAMFDRGIRYYATQNGGYSYVFEKISPLLKSVDLVVANLEGPITDNNSVSANTAPGSYNNYFFTFDPLVAKELYNQNIKVVSLGNNHILNFGQKGLQSTKEYLDQSKVEYFALPNGAKSAFTEINGIKIAFVGYNEFSGDNAEEIATIEEIKKVKQNNDFVVVFCHWGVEYETSTSEPQRELAHKFIDEGADLIIGSHPHVAQQIEIYKQKRIYYSLGNFIFDQYFSEDVRKGLGVELIMDKNKHTLEFNEINFYLEKTGQTVVR